MGRFLEHEKERYVATKAGATYLSAGAKAGGEYKRRERPFCIPRRLADENLFAGIRADVLDYFQRHSIKWHDATIAGPSNHLCDSQVCCVNFLGPFSDQPEALVSLLTPVYPDIRKALPVEHSRYVAFEWIGKSNYLREKIRGNRPRTRGANFTSADAAVRLLQDDGSIRVVLIEWKYTEAYGAQCLRISRSGTDRTAIYEPFYRRPDGPIDQSKITDFADLFYEPFYQLLRQQLLAREMELAKELDADRVSLLHLAPAANLDFRRVTSPGLRSLGHSPADVWHALIKDPDTFSSRSVEGLFGAFPISQHPALKSWWEYLKERYSWVS